MKISIIMAIYNGEKHIRDALESILNQTYKDFEVIIIDDGSIDNSINIIKEYQKYDDRIKLILNSVNIGLTKSLNKAIYNANGKYIARQDDDDISFPERLEKQLYFLENNPEYAFCGCNGIIMQNKMEIIKYFELDEIQKELIKNNCFTHTTIFIRKEILQKFGNYNEKYLYGQDYELWCRLIFKHQLKAKNLKEKLVSMNIPIESLTVKAKQKFLIQKINEIKTKFSYLRYSSNKFQGLLSILKNTLEIVYTYIFNRN